LELTVTIDKMFSPFTIRSLTVPNRFAMAPMTRAASPHGVPGTDVAEYYRRRAAGGVGLIITESVRLPDPAANHPFAIPTMAGDEVLSGWKSVVDAVHAEGGTIAAQLAHAGSARDDSDGVETVSPSGIDLAGRPKGRALATDELVELAAAFADAAKAAREVGMDAVELHGSHGYLLDQFLWERTNRRTDESGGDLQSRTRFPADVVAAVRAAVGSDYPIGYRFSQWKIAEYDAALATDPTQLRELLTPLVEAGVDMLHTSTRRHYTPGFPDADPTLSLAGWTKKVTGVPVIAVGSVGLQTQFVVPQFEEGTTQFRTKQDDVIAPDSVDRVVEQFDAGEFDVVAVGRALLSDPAWVNRVRTGSLDGFKGYDANTALASLI
jgi:2,4-dienoyl-CoA reductase-like NADH-dependent reductase (Old Yellow Enzyme family)